MNPRTAKNGDCVSIIPNNAPKDTGSIVKVYDLRDPEVWERAGRELDAWGRSRSVIHTLDLDHVAIEFRPGGALEGP
jgi:hypothetical protein